jgi:prepilin-type N-terminal cleavage/methylation domain-containing protein
MRARVSRRLGRVQGDAGVSLVEMLVAIVLLSVVLGIAVTMLTSAQRSAEGTISEHQAIEEARLGLNRVSRELRQATAIRYALNADGPGRSESAVTMISFEADFDGDGCIAGSPSCAAVNPADPESLTYCHQPAAGGDAGRLYIIPQLVLTPTTSCESLGVPILAGRVDRFQLQYRSNEYRYDLSPTDGVTSWQELDAAPAPVGNGNGTLDDELGSVNSLVVDLTLDAGTGRTYRTHVALRNKT